MTTTATTETSTTASNSYLIGEHTPVDRELSVASLEVQGTLPAELNGMFCRNSPNPRFAPIGKYHWFDGDGMVHGVRFHDGKASYANRWIRTAGLAKEEAAGKAMWTGILQPAGPDAPRPPLKDTANTDLVVHRGRLYATWWMAGTLYELDVTDLSTKGPERFGDKLKGGFSAHPKVDPRTGEMVFFDFNLMKTPFLKYGVVDANGELAVYEGIDVDQPHILHDCAITERYSILLDLPLGWDLEALMAGKRRIRFDRNAPARFGVIPRRGAGSDVKWFEAESCYVYHTINAYEDGDDVVVVGCRVRDLIPETPDETGRVAKLDSIELQPHLYRWRFSMKTGAVKEEQLDDVATEFPRANDARMGTKLRYSYNPRIAQRPDAMFDALIKYDLERGSSSTYAYQEGWFGSEATFIPRVSGDAGLQIDEDDGFLTTILTKVGERSRAIVLDAKRLELIATVLLPQQVPIGFHTAWVPGP